MTKTVVLLGAGASVDAGMPTSRELTKHVWDRLASSSDHKHLKAILGYVIGALTAKQAKQGFSPYDEIDIEQALEAVKLLLNLDQNTLSAFVYSWDPAISNISYQYDPAEFQRGMHLAFKGFRELLQQQGSGWFHFNNGLEQASKSIRRPSITESSDQKKVLIWRTLTKQVEEKLEVEPEQTRYLDPLITKCLDQKWIVASLNYDLSFEEACKRNNIEYSYGLEQWNKKKIIKWQKNFSGQRILKLHGSINWRNKIIESHEDISIFSKRDDEYDKNPPFLIIGGGNKLTAYGPFLPMLNEFDRALNQANRLIIIGYSFRDEHVNALLYRWSFGSKNRKAIIVDPAFPEGTFLSGWQFQSQQANSDNMSQDIAKRALGVLSGLQRDLVYRIGKRPQNLRIEIHEKKANEGIAELF